MYTRNFKVINKIKIFVKITIFYIKSYIEIFAYTFYGFLINFIDFILFFQFDFFAYTQSLSQSTKVEMTVKGIL